MPQLHWQTSTRNRPVPRHSTETGLSICLTHPEATPHRHDHTTAKEPGSAALRRVLPRAQLSTDFRFSIVRRESWPPARFVTFTLGDRGTEMAQMNWYGAS
jgi:hypothetical protein